MDNARTALIIGGGPAGLSAAYELQRLGWDGRIVIAEQNDKVGGISRTVTRGKHRTDLGGHRLFSKNKEICDIWDELMPVQGAPSFDDKLLNRKLDWPAGGPDPEQTDVVRLLRPRMSRIYFRKHLFYYPLGRKLDFLKALRFDECISILWSYLKVLISPREVKSLEDFYVNHFGYKLYSLFFEYYTEKLWGIHPSKLEPDFGVQRVRGVSIMGVLRDMIIKTLHVANKQNVETSLIDQYTYPKYGIGQLWETMVEKMVAKGAELNLNTKVKEIIVRNHRVVSAVIEDANGDEHAIEPETVLSSMPIPELFAAIRSEERPQEIFDLASRLRHRAFLQVSVLSNGMKLKNTAEGSGINGIIPDSWLYIQDRGVRMGRITIQNNWSPYLLADPEHTVMMGVEYFCDENDEFWNEDDSVLCQLAVGELEKLGVISRDQVLDSFVTRVPKAYPCYDTSYRRMNELVDYLQTIDNLYCIGRNGQHRYNNMDHSMMTGLLAARHIQGQLDSKRVIWNVNAEAAYHEESSESKK
ncbi:NAD(P)/FAD-dependent oxidoreductase [bacterium]|nr:NAD(P)/FAD-dependent oxidoreductase [bacterium]